MGTLPIHPTTAAPPMPHASVVISTLCLAAAVTAAGAPGAARAQDATRLPADTVPLRDLAAFRSAGANWRVVGDVTADRRRAHAVSTAPGSGVLVNVAPPGEGADLLTGWEHGDVELELEFLMPKGSNSGVYFQGRYEVQLFDSWGARAPTFADAGGIYQRWDPARGQGREGFEGHPPRVNAARAPGLWQTLRVQFRAPRFDAQGKKVADARFVRVEHNGVVVHENVRVGGPTRAAAFQDERPAGPLVLQGDHGPVAFRNVRVKRSTGERLRLSGLRYRVREGTFATLAEAVAGAPAREGAADGISSALAGVPDKFAMTFDGTLHAPAAGRYAFELGFDWIDDDPHFTGTVLGQGRVSVGGRDVVVHDGRRASAAGVVELPAGEHPISVTFYKNRPWANQRTGALLFVEGPGVARHALHPERVPDLPGAITVAPSGGPVVLRSFVRHGDAKRTHAVSVGDPAGVHFSVDLARGALLAAWRGPFAETTEMWHDRGNDQVVHPLGSVLALPPAPPVAVLASAAAPWPDGAAADSALAYRGYTLDAAGRPTFLYRLRGVEVEDRLRPADDGASLRRELRLRAPAGADGADGVHVRLALGSSVRRLPDGSYLVGGAGGAHYVVPDPGAPALVVRDAPGGQELVVPVRVRNGEATLAYTLTW
jgi:hypothetical protein